MDPPIQTEYLRSGGAMILIFIGTLWYLPKEQCWRTSPYGYQHRTS
ncbi:CLUMA_CG003261, isoform A [Clunio marinus]|uniref:CLUMA_CG003261, isoform A n=1 Tax=Clunio marinus TaxID=568069 RepID=A0A1J1HNS5_9DIPT|nr:CLUMA_CG003261, isoform A [Clunio marinus]